MINFIERMEKIPIFAPYVTDNITKEAVENALNEGFLGMGGVVKQFEEHIHDNGEEIFVLEGIFSDQYGDYPKGTYLRNPHNSNHVPFSKDGCKIFVKLRQFKKGDNISIVKNTLNSEWLQGLVPGLKVMPLHEYQTEHAAMVKWEPNTRFNAHKHWGGEEIYVVDGVFYDQFGAYPKGTWIRSPHLSEHQPFTRSEGALIFVKTGHL